MCSLHLLVETVRGERNSRPVRQAEIGVVLYVLSYAAGDIVGNPAVVVAYKLKIHGVITLLLTGEPDLSIDFWTLCKINGSAINNPNCIRKTMISCKPLGDFAMLL